MKIVKPPGILRAYSSIIWFYAFRMADRLQNSLLQVPEQVGTEMLHLLLVGMLQPEEQLLAEPDHE